MPVGEVVFYAEHISTLEAQERMNSIADMAAAHGLMKKGAGGRHMKDLARMARGSGRHHVGDSTAVDPTSVESAAKFAEFGISVTTVSVDNG